MVRYIMKLLHKRDLMYHEGFVRVKHHQGLVSFLVNLLVKRVVTVPGGKCCLLVVRK